MRVVLTILLLICSLSVSGQDRGVELSSRYDDKGNFIIDAELKAKGVYTVVLTFTKVENFHIQRVSTHTVRSNRQLMKIPPINESQRISAGYHYSYWLGILNNKPGTNFVYLMPCSKYSDYPSYSYRMSKRGFEMHNQRISWFYCDKADTVFAARKGMLVKISDGSFVNGHSDVTLQHDDGTLADYAGLTFMNMPQLGDVFMPGDPLGLAGMDKTGKHSYALIVRQLRMDKNNKLQYDDIWPVFATNNGITRPGSDIDYFPVVTPELVMAEMTKKEQKAYKDSPQYAALASLPKRGFTAKRSVRTELTQQQSASNTSEQTSLNESIVGASGPVSLISRGERDRSYTMTARKNKPGLYSFIIHFELNIGYNVPETVMDTLTVTRTVLKAPFIKGEDTGRLSYSFVSYLGLAGVDADSTCLYALPFKWKAEGVRATARQEENNICMNFVLAKGDTVLAMRPGIVVEKEETAPGIDYVKVQHTDGSCLSYMNLAVSDKIVAVGDNVAAGAPLGVVSSDASYGFRLTVRAQRLVYGMGTDKNRMSFSYKGFMPVLQTAAGKVKLSATAQTLRHPAKR